MEVRQWIDAARREYTRRHDELRTALLAQGIDVPPTSGGFNVWVPLPKDAKDVAYALAKKGWLIRLGGTFDVQGQSQAIRVTVSKLQEGQALRFAQDLKACLA
jgi:DNA-binding transcriptional MocR family regulator